IMGIDSYMVSKYQSQKIDGIRFEGIFNLINSNEIDFVLVEYLICEIEIYLKNIKKIAQWSVGILSTLIVLLVSFFGSTFTKFSELFFQAFDKVDQQEFLKLISN
ncbi:hypothetical protein, partial [Citrobacter braakii]|uniref:hypothetical protein n=1 Tax=Citrobacter braakii TaxID=57706 RepID=UPI0037C09CDB